MPKEFDRTQKVNATGSVWIPMSNANVKRICGKENGAIADRILGNRAPGKHTRWDNDGYGICWSKDTRRDSTFQVLVYKPENIELVTSTLTTMEEKIRASAKGLVEATVAEDEKIDLTGNTQSQLIDKFDVRESLGLPELEVPDAIKILEGHADIELYLDSVADILTPLIGLAVIEGYKMIGGANTKNSFQKRCYSSLVDIAEVRPNVNKRGSSAGRKTFTHSHQLVQSVSDLTGNDLGQLRLNCIPIPGAMGPDFTHLHPDSVSSSSGALMPASDHDGADIEAIMPRSAKMVRIMLEDPDKPEERAVDGNSTVTSVDTMVEVEEGVLKTLPAPGSRGPYQPPLKTEGGSNNRTADRYDSKHTGTRMQTTGQGETSNPMGHIPSSSFNPAPEWLSSAFAGPMAFFSDPKVAFAVIGIVVLLQEKDKKEHTYSEVYKVLPSMIVDNQVIEDDLFGAGSGYALGLGPTPDIGQPETQE